MRLAQEYFRDAVRLRQTENILKEKVVELVGAIGPGHVSFAPEEDEVIISAPSKSLTVTPEAQQTLYGMGVKRIFILGTDGYETYYYTGGDARGYRKIHED